MEIANIANSPSASLTLGYRALKPTSAQVYHSKAVSGTKHAGQYEPRQQHFLMGLGLKGDEYLELLEVLVSTPSVTTDEQLLTKICRTCPTLLSSWCL